MLPIQDRIGISTHFMPSTHREDIFDAISLVHEAGFKGFEIVPTLPGIKRDDRRNLEWNSQAGTAVECLKQLVEQNN